MMRTWTPLIWFRVPDLGAAAERTTSGIVLATTAAGIQTAAIPVSIPVSSTEPVFVNFLRSPLIDSQLAA
jgi:hypothetical protein